MNVLLLATDPVLPEFLRRPLVPLGHELEIARSLAELEPALTAGRPRAVLLPRRLPDRDLAAAIGWIAERRAASSVATIVVGLDPADRALADAAGADGFLLIPFSDADLLETLGASTRSRRLVLLADDSPMIHHHTVPILEEAGYEVVSAMDGAEALRVARERRPDLVITDVEMPKLDGYELCAALKDDTETAHVPVLICSSLGEAQDLERGFDAGADDYLVKPVVPEEMTTRVRALLGASLPASRERILVVDDSPAQRHYVADCLARQGFEIVTAGDGAEALERVGEETPALIISDYEMPEMNGFELVHALKRDPETRNIPVIMLTARGSKRDMAQMRAAGASAYLVKPFAQDKCIATVERTLAERRLLDYKKASAVYISSAARRAAEERAAAGELDAVRADEREMSVLFTDIVGFTPLSARMGAGEVIRMLNSYFDVLCPVIVEERGDIDKFIGDAILAVFDDVPGAEQPAERAVRAALAMQGAMPALRRELGIELRTRIGINTGSLVRGDLGSRFVRRDYTVIGDTVNRASRLEAHCPPDGVLVGAVTRERLGDMVTVTETPGLRLKGVPEPVTAYLVHDIVPRKKKMS